MKILLYTIDFGSQNKIVFMQSPDFMSKQSQIHPIVVNADIGMVIFGIGQICNPVHECHRFPEIGEFITFFQLMDFSPG